MKAYCFRSVFSASRLVLQSLGVVFLMALVAVPAGYADTADMAFRQAVAEAAAGDRELAEFYRERDQQPLWTTSGDAARRAAFFAALDKAPNHGLPQGRYNAAKLRAGFESLTSERQRGLLEVAVSKAFLAYAHDVRNGVIDPVSADPGIVRKVPRQGSLATLRAFARSDPRAFIGSLPPKGPQYLALMKARLDLEFTLQSGGWGPELSTNPVKPGDRGAQVIALRDRLVRMGYLRRTAAETYDGALQKAVQQFQIEHGLAPDGVAGNATIDEINVGVEDRLKSVLVAMERLRWMNGLTLGKRYIWVNLPDFTAKIVDDGKVTFETVTVVGMNQHDRRSPEFSDQMEFMVINPTWNVPRSIVVKEYLPMLQANPQAAGNLKIVDRRGRVVNREETDFTQFTAQNFPFSMSEPPSNGNALGLVKFMFPNQWNIYLHDTPSKSLFKRQVRAFSHGCIRLGDPFDFAYALLAPQTDDPKGEFAAHLNTRSETTLPLENPVPVHIVYFTAWPSAKGRIDYRRDVYGRDARVFDALEKAGVVLPAVQG